MGSNNVLLHLRHHHPLDHAKIVEHLTKDQQQPEKMAPKTDSLGKSQPKVQQHPTVVIKSEPENEPLQIKLEIVEDE